MKFLIAALMSGLIALGVAFAAPPSNVWVNGQRLSTEDLAAVQRQTGPIQPGRYWYDARAGLWGLEGGPTAGETAPGIQGVAMKANASGGGNGRLTGVFINGREIHPADYQFLTAVFGAVYPGRYWLDASGLGGVEGGPPAFNLRVAVAQAAARAAPRNTGGGNPGSVYVPGIGGNPGIGVGQASDGCTYVSYGGYSNDFC